MNTTGWSLAVAAGLAALGAFAALGTPRRQRPAIVGICTAGIGIAGVVAGVCALGGERFTASLPWLLPLSGVRLETDPLAGLFIAVTGAVVTVAAIYGIGYASARGPASGGERPDPVMEAGTETVGNDHAGHTGHGDARTVQALLPLFAWAMLLVPCAASVTTLLVAWELMAIASLLLIVAEHRRGAVVGSAGLWYAAMTQFGFVTILLGLVFFVGGTGATADGGSFDALRQAQPSAALRGLVFVLVFMGFGSKAGLVPLHVWLPRAHPEAPSHISAMLSAAMVNMGVYGVVRVGFDLLHGGERWWWLLVLAAGSVSALYGILQAAVASDLKRLLAYSTVENMGLVFVGVGAAGVFRASNAPVLASLALAAAMLHVLNHAAFKALLFFAAGSVLRATGTRDLDALGGLRGRMPVTTALFAVGALAAAALPPSNGFVSEWVLLQSLVHTVPSGGVVTAVAMPTAVAVVALTAGLAVATMVKALGVGFFARPRGAGAATAVESPKSMLSAMGLLALTCAALALAPSALGPALSRASAIAGNGAGPGGAVSAGAVGDPAGALTTGGSATINAISTSSGVVDAGLTLRLAGVSSTLSPLWIAVALVLATIATAGLVRLVSARVPRRERAPLWDCGAGQPTERMQYTATSFAQPLQRVFDDVLAPETDVDITPQPQSRYLLAQVRYRLRVPDRIEHRLYGPLIAAAKRAGRAGPVLANGSVHRYLAYGFVGVLALLVTLAVAG